MTAITKHPKQHNKLLILPKFYKNLKKMNFGDNSGQGMPAIDPALQQFIQNETEKQKLQVRKAPPLSCFIIKASCTWVTWCQLIFNMAI